MFTQPPSEQSYRDSCDFHITYRHSSQFGMILHTGSCLFTVSCVTTKALYKPTSRSRIVNNYIVPHLQLVLNCSPISLSPTEHHLINEIYYVLYVLAYCSIKYYWNQLWLTTLMRWESHELSSTLSWLTTRECQVKQGLESHKRPTYRSQCPCQTMPHLYDCAPHRRKSWFYSDLLRSETTWEKLGYTCRNVAPTCQLTIFQ